MVLAYSLLRVFVEATIHLPQMSRGDPHIIMMVKLCTQLLQGEKQSYELQYYDFPGSNEDITLLLYCITVAVLCHI